MMNKLGLCGYTLFFISCFGISKNVAAQVTPINPLPGPWIQLSGVSQSTTLFGTGIGTLVPEGWLEIKYCGGSSTGLMITQDNCGMVGVLNDVLNPSLDGIIEFNSLDPGSSGGGFVSPLNFDLRPYNSFGNKPLIWARAQNSSMFTASSGPHTTRFVVTPFGRSGFNIENPRATLDVKSLGGYNQPVAIFGRQKLGTANRTQHVHIVPLLYEDGYNVISQTNDQGIFFTDGLGQDGSNSTGAFVLAPWADNSFTDIVGGLRMDWQGNVEFHGEVRATKISVNAKWWSDFVFEPTYKLTTFNDLRSYIAANKHLPGVPAESEVLENGLDLADMQAIHMQKIEELTLYILELESRISALEQKGKGSNDVGGE